MESSRIESGSGGIKTPLRSQAGLGDKDKYYERISFTFSFFFQSLRCRVHVQIMLRFGTYMIRFREKSYVWRHHCMLTFGGEYDPFRRECTTFQKQFFSFLCKLGNVS